MPSADELLEVCITAARAAGAVLLEGLTRDKEVQLKSVRSSIVTWADVTAQAEIFRVIGEHFPEHAILGEEGDGGGSDTSHTWIVDPLEGAFLGAISLAAFADADGLPEMQRLAHVNGRVFVSLQRLDRDLFFSPTDSSQVVVVDAATDALVDCDPVAPGVQGIVLPFQNPTTGNDEGLPNRMVRIDPSTLRSANRVVAGS